MKPAFADSALTMLRGFLALLHIDGLDVDPQRALAIAQRYVDGEISVDELTGAIIALSTDGSHLYLLDIICGPVRTHRQIKLR